VNSIGLNGAGNVDQIFIDHWNEGGVMFRGKRLEKLVELSNVIGAVVWWQGDSREQYFNMRRLERGDDLIKIAARLFKGQASEPIVAAEFNDHNIGVKAQDGLDSGNCIFGGGATGALIYDLVVVTAGGEKFIQGVRESLTFKKAMTCGDAVAVADKHPRRGGRKPERKQHERNCNKKYAANVHIDSVAALGCREGSGEGEAGW
jgi:hypothetical protein